MKEIKIFEEIIASKGKTLKEAGVSYTLFNAYYYSKEAGNELIDFNEIIWDKDIEAIVKTCKENGITEFTISSNMTSLIETLAEFEKHGCKMNGITRVYSRHINFITKEKDVIPAIKMVLM